MSDEKVRLSPKARVEQHETMGRRWQGPCGANAQQVKTEEMEC